MQCWLRQTERGLAGVSVLPSTPKKTPPRSLSGGSLPVKLGGVEIASKSVRRAKRTCLHVAACLNEDGVEPWVRGLRLCGCARARVLPGPTPAHAHMLLRLRARSSPVRRTTRAPSSPR